MATASSNWLAEAAAVLGKDLRVEYRTRYAIVAIVLFAITTLTAISFAVGQGSSAPVQAALLWIVLYFAALSGLTRTFVAEEDGRTAEGLRLATSGLGIYVGKLAFNWLLVAAMAILLTPGFALFMSLEVKLPGLLVTTMAAGCLAFGAALTATAALVAQARSRGALAAILSFPLVVPLLKLAIDATAAALVGDVRGWSMAVSLAALGGVFAVLAALLFESLQTA